MSCSVNSSAEESCPICCEELSHADLQYPIHCPTPTCSYNFCLSCIQSLLRAHDDGYQEASDGSRQMKIWLKCPICRGKYACPKYTPKLVLGAIVACRQAQSFQDETTQEIGENDENQHVSANSRRRNSTKATKRFLKQGHTVDSLETAVLRVATYQAQIGRDLPPVPELDWTTIRCAIDAPHFPQHATKPTHVLKTSRLMNSDHSVSTNSTLPASLSSCCSGSLMHEDEKDDESFTSEALDGLWKDPTLFLGLDELVSDDEQIFLTHLMTGGNVDCVAQSTRILHGLQRTGALSAGSSSTTDPADLHRIRRRYPLPRRMPLCVSWPIHDPQQRITRANADQMLKFQNDHNSLVLDSIRGQAGKLGLRRGDIVTHVDGQRVHSAVDYEKVMIQAYMNEQAHLIGDSVLLVVNADQETANLLRDRATMMRYDSVRL